MQNFALLWNCSIYKEVAHPYFSLLIGMTSPGHANSAQRWMGWLMNEPTDDISTHPCQIILTELATLPICEISNDEDILERWRAAAVMSVDKTLITYY